MVKIFFAAGLDIPSSALAAEVLFGRHGEYSAPYPASACPATGPRHGGQVTVDGGVLRYHGDLSRPLEVWVALVVVRDRVDLDDLLIEAIHDGFAQDDVGNIWSMGEEVDNCVLAEGKAVRLELELRTPVFVQGSAGLLVECVPNLLENAIRHTPERGAGVGSGDGPRDRPRARGCRDRQQRSRSR